MWSHSHQLSKNSDLPLSSSWKAKRILQIIRQKVENRWENFIYSTVQIGSVPAFWVLSVALITHLEGTEADLEECMQLCMLPPPWFRQAHTDMSGELLPNSVCRLLL